MRVLLSIKPEYAEKILTGEKRFEYRKAVFKSPQVNRVVIYATRPTGMIVGEFEVGEIIAGCPEKVWELTSDFSGISNDFFDHYFDGREIAYAISVKNPRRYTDPVGLTKYVSNGVAPQSFCYL